MLITLKKKLTYLILVHVHCCIDRSIEFEKYPPAAGHTHSLPLSLSVFLWLNFSWLRTDLTQWTGLSVVREFSAQHAEVRLSVGCQQPAGRGQRSALWNIQSFPVWLIGKNQALFFNSCSFKMMNYWPASTVGQVTVIYCFSSWLGQYVVLFNYSIVEL